jgi:hypothetical protein
MFRCVESMIPVDITLLCRGRYTKRTQVGNCKIGNAAEYIGPTCIIGEFFLLLFLNIDDLRLFLFILLIFGYIFGYIFFFLILFLWNSLFQNGNQKDLYDETLRYCSCEVELTKGIVERRIASILFFWIGAPQCPKQEDYVRSYWKDPIG